jgi:hypothetical protein
MVVHMGHTEILHRLVSPGRTNMVPIQKKYLSIKKYFTKPSCLYLQTVMM